MIIGYLGGQIGNLVMALRKAGFTPADIVALTGCDLERIRRVIRGLAEIVDIKRVIDCDADPYVPTSWCVDRHMKMGLIDWNPEQAELYFSPNQKLGTSVYGYVLRRHLEDKPVLNANVAAYLLANPGLIPGDWRRKMGTVCFWGTTYCGSRNSCFVPLIRWTGGKWVSDYRDLNKGFRCPAALWRGPVERHEAPAETIP